ncbi:MAG: hypothetical protein AAF724_08230 [Pseudomonadota bacterium]
MVFAAPHAPHAPQVLTFFAPHAPHAPQALAAPQAPHAPQAVTFVEPQAAQDATVGVVPATAAASPPPTTIIASAFLDFLFMEFSSDWPKTSFGASHPNGRLHQLVSRWDGAKSRFCETIVMGLSADFRSQNVAKRYPSVRRVMWFCKLPAPAFETGKAVWFAARSGFQH